MITRKAPTSLFPYLHPSTASYICHQCRHLHKNVPAGKVPVPTPFVPDPATFLTLIGRNLSKHVDKISSWHDLFTLSSPQLRDMGIEPARTRRYLLHWREKFRKGEFGIGGDLKYVKDGVAELRVVELPSLKGPEDLNSTRGDVKSPEVSTSQNPDKTKLILNVPSGSETYVLEEGQTTADLKKPQGFKLHQGHIIVGSYVQPVKGANGSVATLKVREGLWEHRRGHKVDGGERRKAEVRFKRGVAERKAQRM